MKQLNVTYHAPPGDSKVVEVFGHTFYDGKSETVEVDERVEGKLRGNHHFDVNDAAPKNEGAKPKGEASDGKSKPLDADMPDDGRPSTGAPKPKKDQ